MSKWFVDIFISFCLMIDKMLFSINKLLFDLFMKVSMVKIPAEFFDKLINNLYVIIGIFMIFRVAFSLIQMLANPDMIADKEKGAGKLATRIVIAFGLIIMVPTIFDYAYDLQGAILKDNILGRLILGDSGSNSDQNNSAIQSQGQLMSLNIFKSMIDISEGVSTDSDPGKKCKEALSIDSTSGYTSIDSLRNVDGTDCFTEQVNDIYIYDYKILVSSIALGMISWLMVGFCIDIGVRLIKLTFLQLIAPVCIVTYVGGGKDNAFNKWMKMAISSYISMFIKLIVIYFVVYVAGNFPFKELDLSGLAYVVVILGLLVFAKNATKLIGDLFGVKMDEESGFKGLAKTALLGGAAMAASGGLAGISNLAKGVGDTAKNVTKAGGLKSGAGWKALGMGALGAVGSTIAGTTSGAFQGAKGGFKKNASLGGTINKALMTSRTNRDNRDDRAAVYGGGIKSAWNNLVADRVLGFAGIDTKAKKVVNQHKNIGSGLSRAKSNVLSAQNNWAETHSVNLDEMNKYSYNAFDNEWSYYDSNTGQVTGFGKNVDLNTIVANQGINADDAQYLKFTEQDSMLERRIIENNKAQGKAETQQKKMERTNGNK